MKLPRLLIPVVVFVAAGVAVAVTVLSGDDPAHPVRGRQELLGDDPLQGD